MLLLRLLIVCRVRAHAGACVGLHVRLLLLLLLRVAGVCSALRIVRWLSLIRALVSLGRRRVLLLLSVTGAGVPLARVRRAAALLLLLLASYFRFLPHGTC